MKKRIVFWVLLCSFFVLWMYDAAINFSIAMWQCQASFEVCDESIILSRFIFGEIHAFDWRKE